MQQPKGSGKRLAEVSLDAYVRMQIEWILNQHDVRTLCAILNISTRLVSSLARGR
jgi:hypothetical protein